MVGPDARIANLAAVMEVFGRVGGEPVAVRGDDLVLYRWTISDDAGFATSGYDVAELDGSGRIARLVTFDDDDFGGALEELDERYAARRPPAAEVQVLAAYAALARRVWDAFRAYLADDLVVVDRRRLGFPEGRGPASLTDELRRLVEQVPDVLAYVTRIESRGNVALVTTHQTGTASYGGGAEWDFVTVICVDPTSGRIERIEYFDADRWDDARARFEAVTGAAPEAAETSLHLARTITDAFAARDWDAIRALTGDDIRLVDRRSTVSSHDAVGADAVIALLRGFAEVGFLSMENEVLETRRVGLNLLRRTFRTESGFELQMLAVAQLGADERSASLVLFDVDDVDAATAELDRRAAAPTPDR
jgi:hypothetical protein